jgi:hypothetical protein
MFCARCPSLPLVMTGLCAVLGAHDGGKGCGCVPARRPDGWAHGGAGGRAASGTASGDRAQQQPGSLVQPPLKIFLAPSLKTDRPPLAPLAAVETRSQNLIISLPPARHVVRPQLNLESISTAATVLQRADHGTQVYVPSYQNLITLIPTILSSGVRVCLAILCGPSLLQFMLLEG